MYHYFSRKLDTEVKEVYWHTFLYSLALSLVFIFEPIYLHRLGFSLPQIMWFYVQIYVWYALLISFGARFASRFGYKHAIFVSNIFYVVYWIALFFIRAEPWLFYLAPALFALQKSWFWPAYDADVAISSQKVQRGREVGVLQVVIQSAFVSGPFLGGALSHNLGFSALFAAAAALMLLSVYPLFRSGEIYTRHRFRFRNFWAIFREYPRNFFGYFGYAEDLMVQSLWPVYMFLVIPSVFNVGAVSAVATLIGAVLMLYMGGLADRGDKRRLICRSSLGYGLTWIFRFFARGLPAVLGFDALTKTAKDLTAVPMIALTYERAGARGPDFAIAYSVFYEFSLSIGKILTALAAIAILAAGGSIFWVFALAGIMTMMYGLLK